MPILPQETEQAARFKHLKVTPPAHTAVSQLYELLDQIGIACYFEEIYSAGITWESITTGVRVCFFKKFNFSGY